MSRLSRPKFIGEPVSLIVRPMFGSGADGEESMSKTLCVLML
jgi:hypothetical protein